MGHELGMEDGVDGGVVGGVRGGVPGGVPGGSGSGAVLDYDSPPQLVRQTKPSYPQEAFVKKVEGEVELEILIDPFGRVVGTRVLRSIPLLDAAAVACVREWTFRPAVRRGVPVATLARAPIGFTLY
jgi:protein TonB